MISALRPMIWLLLLVLVIARPARTQNRSDILKEGEQVFNRTCTGYCHGVNGEYGGAPRLAGRGFDLAYITDTIAHGVPGTGMLPFGKSLSSADLAAVVAYVASLNGITNPELMFNASPGEQREAEESILSKEAARGHDLFYDAVRGFGRCSTCHEVRGMGVPVTTKITAVPSDVGMLRELTTPQVRTATLRGEAMPVLLLSQGKERTLFYDLTSVPPVLRTVDSTTVEITKGTNWRHASILSSYDDAELAAILDFLREVVKP